MLTNRATCANVLFRIVSIARPRWIRCSLLKEWSKE